MKVKVVKKGSAKAKPGNWCPYLVDSIPPDVNGR
jgi:hypothetical protein